MRKAAARIEAGCLNGRSIEHLSAELDANGVLRWQFPEGDWEVLRFGCTIGDHSRVSTCSEGWDAVCW